MREQHIIGRETEKVELSGCLERALAGNGRVVLLSGEAGIGKSTLVSHLGSAAAASGMCVCVGECTAQDAGIPYQGFQRALSDIADDALFSLEEFTHFDEVFLISNIGLLISHVSRSKEGGMDEDILGSMLTAVQDFVKDSFGGQGEGAQTGGGLGKLEYMNTKIFIEHGDTAFLAVVTSGQEHSDMKHDIMRCLADVESKYFDLLVNWDGDVDALSGSVDMLEALVRRNFRVRRSLENINIESERLKVQNRIYEMMQARAGEKGLLVVLEDIHWADESTVMAIPFIARNISQDRIVFCLTYRPEEVEEKPGARSVIEQVVSGSDCKAIDLESLDDDSLRGLVSGMLDGGDPPEELMTDLMAETQGNPFFVTEAIRALLAEGVLARDRDVWIMRHGPKSSIPHNVVELVSRRLETLDLDCLRLVEYGAVLGRRFSMPILASGFRMNEAHVRELAAHLVSINIFVETGEEVMFQHSKIQEVIYSGMSDRWRRMAHRNAGLTYERLFKDNKDDVLFNLAYHFSRTIDFDKGIEYCVSAGYKASNNFAPREACKFFEKAVEIIEMTERSDSRYIELNQALGELFELDGDYARALALLDKVLGATMEKSIRANVFMVRGRVLQSQSRYDDAIAAYEQGISLADEIGSNLLKAKINGYLGKIYLRKGEQEKALDLQKKFLAESKKAGDEREVGQAYMNMGGAYWFMNDQQSAIRHWEDALGIFEMLNYTQGIANTNDNLGVGYSTVGQFEKSLEHYRRSEEIMSRIGDVRGMSMVLLNIGVLYDRLGEHEKSLDHYMRSLQIKKKIGDNIGAATLYNNIGGAYFDMGLYEEAEESYRLNLELMEKFEDTWGVSQALNNLAELKIEVALLDEAYTLCEHSLQIAREHDFKEIMASDLRLMGVLASLNGDYGAADSNFKESLDLAEGVEDPQRIGMVYFSMGRSYIARGDREKALDSFSSALKTFEESGMETFARKTRREMQGIVDSAVSD